MIAKKGEVLYEKYFGYSDIENKVPLNADNVFRQASLAKVAEYTLGMMLFEKGLFNMTDPLYEYFPEWRHSTKRIVLDGERFMGRKTIDLMRSNTITQEMIDNDFTNDYLAGYGYGFGVRTLMDKGRGNHNGSLGAFGWTGGSGTWAESDPSEGVSIVYMHNLQPNLEEYHHLRMRAVAYGCLD